MGSAKSDTITKVIGHTKRIRPQADRFDDVRDKTKPPVTLVVHLFEITRSFVSRDCADESYMLPSVVYFTVLLQQ